MSVDLADLVENVKFEVNPPGQDLYPNATDDEWASRLANAFWDSRIEGFLAGYTELDGEIFPVTGTTDMPRDLQQVIVFLCAYSTITQRLREFQTAFRAKAGPAEFEVERSATAITAQIKALEDRKAIILTRLSDLGIIPAFVIDGVVARQNALVSWGTGWTR